MKPTIENTAPGSDCQERLVRLQADYEKAARAMCQAVAAEYPLGTLVEAKVGQNYIRGEVTSHNDSWWWEPGSMTIRNVKTGKFRRVNPTCKHSDVEIISLPNA